MTSRTSLVWLYAITTFLASALLFAAEPMIGKRILPMFGGTPGVWNTCLLYFQLIVLLGYMLTNRVQDAPHRAVDAAVARPYLAMLVILSGMGTFLPIAPDDQFAQQAADPTAGVLLTLLDSATASLILLAAAAPLVQHWFRLTGDPRGDDPYFLYAASNAGSLLALFAYPMVVEPNLRLDTQFRLWRWGFVATSALLLACGWYARVLQKRREPPAEASEPSPAPGLRTILGWIVLAFVPSSWLMGVTQYLTTDLAPMPMLWVIPLSLYLLSFIIAFAGPDSRLVRLSALVLPACVMALVLVLAAGFVHAFWIPLHLLTFFAGAVACHGALARLRPPAHQLSTFYVTIATGGLIGGVFNALLAPTLFDRIVEYPLAIVLGGFLAMAGSSFAMPSGRRAWLGEFLPPTVIVVITAMLVTGSSGLSQSTLGVLGVMLASGLGFLMLRTSRRRPLRFALAAGGVLAASGLSQGMSGRLLHIDRDFFGVVRVTEDADRNVHRLFHGSTLHGQQALDPSAAREPSTYFTRSGPIGQLFEAMSARLDRPGSQIAIVGLGAGTLAAYARSGQRWTFYEIDPLMEQIARDPRYFTYLRDARADALDIVLGDARIQLREAADDAYALIVLDAFSSDSLPVHLVSREAIQLYRSKLAEGGVLAFNLSNRYLDLDPLIGRQAEAERLACRVCYDLDVSKEQRQAGKQPSIWAVMAAHESDLAGLADDPRWQHPHIRPGSRAWTDDYSDLASYLRWRPVR